MADTAVKVVLLPEQTDKEAVLILTDGVTIVLVVIVSELLVAVGVPAHVALLVITTVTTSLLAIVEVVKVALLVPAFTPFIFH